MSGISARHLLEHVIRPTLNYMTESTGLMMAGRSAEMLVLGTAATETHCGQWLVQYPSGPGKGIYQMEPDTHRDLHTYLGRRADIGDTVVSLCACDPQPGEMIHNLAYATACCRAQYWRQPEPLPEWDDLVGLGRYWKQYWNTEKGAGSVDRFVSDFRLHAGSVLNG